MRKLHYVFILVGLIIGMLPVIQVPASTYAQPATTITLSTVDVGVAEATFVEARIGCGVAEGCSAFAINLTFDRDIIRVHSAQFGPYLGENVFGATNVVDNGNGTVTLSGAALQPPPPGAENILFRLEVGGLFPGTATIGVVNATVTAATGAEVPTSGSGTTVNVFDTGKIPFFSPPEPWEVAFVSERDGNPEIYAVLADGTGLRRLTTNDVLDGGPTWSPNGNLLAFHSQIDGGLDVYTMDGDGGNVKRLTDHPASDFQPAWSPDGSKIAFVSERDGSSDIFVMNADGSNVQRITTDAGQEQQPAWSPNGQQIAFSSNRGGAFELFLINADGSGAAQRFTDLFGANGWHPAWKPDGNLLSFTTERDSAADIYTIPPTGQGTTRLTPESNILTSTDWSPDGKFLAYAATVDGVDDIYVLDLERNNYVFRVTGDAEKDYDPDWRPTGEPAGPCLIRTPNNDVTVRVGPGLNRGDFTRLPTNQDFIVTAQYVDADGELWYQLDKTQIAGHEAVNELWVRASDVDAAGACGALAQGTPPPLIPGGDPGNPGGWGPCGSCNTCGHDTSECVTSPAGECLWDPATCGGPGITTVTAVPGDDDDGGQQPTCYTLTLTTSGPGTAYPSPRTTCNNVINSFTAGSATTITAVPAGGWVQSWSGTCPGIPNPGYFVNSAMITMNASCSVHIVFDILISPPLDEPGASAQ